MTEEEKKAEQERLAEAENKKPDEPEETVISFGEGDPPPKEDSSVIREMRSRQKELRREKRELEDKLAVATGREEDKLGPKPTLETCEFDNAEYESQMNLWHEKKSEVSRKREVKEQERQKQKDDWENKLVVHREKASALNIPDYDDAQETVKESFSITQQGLIIDAAKNSAIVVYALGKHPEIATKLAKITDPVKFVAEMSRLETKMTVSKRKPGTKPEEKVEGSGGSTSAGETGLEKLRAKAAISGDYSEVNAYKRNLREKQ